MILYGLSHPVDLDCADVRLVGETGYLKGGPCGHYAAWPKPAYRTIEWLEGSAVVCPFVWILNAIAEVLITEEVRSAFRGASVSGVDYLPVKYYQNQRTQTRKRGAERSRTRLWLPYEGPPLYVLWPDNWVHADPSRSSLKLVQTCPVCGNQVFEVEGMETRRHRWDRNSKTLSEISSDREKGKGVYIREDELRGGDVFRLYELPGWILCTEKVRDIVIEKQFSNIIFLEIGESLPN